MLTRYNDCLAAFRDPRLSRQDQAELEFDILLKGCTEETAQRALRTSLGMVVNLEGSNHARVRRLVTHAFTPKAVAAWRIRIEAIVDRLLAAVENKSEFDFMQELAFPLPQAVMCELVGVPYEDHALWTQWAARQVAFNRADPSGGVGVASARTAIIEFRDYFLDLVRKRRNALGTDLASVLIRAEEEGDRLSEDELVGTLMMLAIAGFETTANLIGNGMNALFDNPRQFDILKADPNLAAQAVEEFLRYESPSRMVLPKRTTDAVVMSGVEIPAGQSVLIVLGAGNRDPAMFDNPDALDIERTNNAHLGFGAGPHFCLGAGFARLEATILFKAVVTRRPDLKRATDTVRWRETFVRGLEELPVVGRQIH